MMATAVHMNTLYYGDNAVIMEKEMAAYRGQVDLIYLDPPFKSDRSYNLLYRSSTGHPVPENLIAFTDTWQFSEETARLLDDMPYLWQQYGVSADALIAWQRWTDILQKTQPSLLAYLAYMTKRLLLMRGLLKSTGSIYLHCDPSASHYLKVVMDLVFGHQHFRNEIVWCYQSRPQPKRTFARKHDILLFYACSEQYTFNWQSVARPLQPSTVKKYRRCDSNGRRYRLQGRGITGSPICSQKDVSPEWELTHPEWVVRDYLDSKVGIAREDWWTDIDILNQVSKERLGYPTQKPIALLRRILLASSQPGDLVFDPFCGCGTTIYAAHETGRHWIGCDIAMIPAHLISHTLAERYRLSEGVHFNIVGEPATLGMVEKVEGFPTRKGPDGGIDGRLFFEVQEGRQRTHHPRPSAGSGRCNGT